VQACAVKEWGERNVAPTTEANKFLMALEHLPPARLGKHRRRPLS